MSLAARLLRTRWFVRAPIIVFRARLGFLFGGRLLLLEHTGRKSGEARFVVLEVVERADAARVVASGFGDRAQWFQNLRANPQCRVSIGMRSRRRTVAEELDAEEVAAVLRRYRRDHRVAYAELHSVIEESTGRPIDDVPMMRLTMN